MIAYNLDQSLADEMVNKAVELSAENLFGGDREKTLIALRRGSGDVSRCFSKNLGELIAVLLVEMDKNVKSIYRYSPESLRIKSDDIGFDAGSAINLIAWVDRKSPALSTLVKTLEVLLSQSQAKIGFGESTAAIVPLDLKMVDDHDVEDKRGFAILVESELIRTQRLWPPIDVKEPERVSEPDEIPQDPLLDLLTSFDPELAPENRILDHAYAIEKIPSEDRGSLEYHLTKLKVSLIRKIISDQLSYINIAKKWFTTDDLSDLYHRRIGYGRIGGKSAGMILAARILQEVADQEVIDCLHIPESYFLGSDLIYIFMAMNGLMHWNDQKYKPEDSIRSEYPQIVEEFQYGELPPEILAALRNILAEIDDKPLIVRSSSQLEDNFGTSFAGKYDSYFCPNQGSPTENLQDLKRAIARIYASTLKPEALLYRRKKGLQDYDERMAILIQVVQGSKFERYFLPHASGIAFSRNIYRWSPDIRREDGFVRLVWGLGTRAVGRVGDDYPRLVALSHPNLQPDNSTEAIRRYSQHYVDLIDLEDNVFRTLPIQDIIKPQYGPLRLLVQLEQDGYFITPRMRISQSDISKMSINFNEFLQRTSFATLIKKILRTIEEHYHGTVDMEFTVHISEPRSPHPQVRISLLQCRPQSHLRDIYPVRIPDNLHEEDIIFSTGFMVPRGYLPKIKHVLFVVPEEYFALPTRQSRGQISVAISRLNDALEEKSFICVGPGRWGSINSDLGVFVSYADIYHAGALVELSGEGIGPDPEPSLGTHFFQDLMEAHIYPLALRLDEKDVQFNQDFFYESTNNISNWIDIDKEIQKSLHLVDVAEYRQGHHIEIVMDDEKSRVIAFLKAD
ncbi:MAG: PEP/pyruvate-binding domain-containing protein [Anaerolineales bacterium]